MTNQKIKSFLDKNDLVYDLNAVPKGVYGSGKMTGFWPYKLAAVLIYGETAGIKKLPGHLILAPMSVLAKVCPASKMEKVREHLASAVAIGIFDSIEYYSEHALITVAPTAWELGHLDVYGRFTELYGPVTRASLYTPPTPLAAPNGTTSSANPKPGRRKVGRPRSWVHVSELPEEYR